MRVVFLNSKALTRRASPHTCSSGITCCRGVQHRTSVLPRTPAIIGSPRWPQHRFHHGPLFLVQFPASRHGASRLSQSSPRIPGIRPLTIYETGSRIPEAPVTCERICGST